MLVKLKKIWNSIKKEANRPTDDMGPFEYNRCKCENQMDTKEVARQAALHYLNSRMKHWNSTAAWFNKPSEEDLNKAEAAINKLKDWAKIQDNVTRKAYEYWLYGFYDTGIEEARQEIRTHTREREHERYREELDRKYESSRKFKIKTPEDICTAT